ncbi:hypothetical protein AMTRI_Chr09g17530 [Amborella trichopoda]
MASPSSSHFESARTEQIISEFFLKGLHVILESRVPFLCSETHRTEQGGLSSSSVSRVRKKDKWFMLAIGECSAASEILNVWHKNAMDPLVIDVVLVQEDSSKAQGSDKEIGSPMKLHAFSDTFTSAQSTSYWNVGEEHFNSSSKETSVKVLERWVMQYESLKSSTRDHLSSKGRGSLGFGETVSHSSDDPTASTRMYKRLILLLRSLYVTSRLLPAYKLFRKLNSSNQSYNFGISYRVSSFVEPFSRMEEREMTNFRFTPVDTAFGRLSLSVSYCTVLPHLNIEDSTSLLPPIIVDYVGSPAADPLKRFPCGSLPKSVDKGYQATSFPSQGIRSSYSSPFQRPHSWSSGLSRCGPPTYSPSPPLYPNYSIPYSTLSDSHASTSNVHGHRVPPCGHHNHDQSAPISYRPSSQKKGTSSEELWLTPPFSPSSSPSPTNSPSCNPLLNRPRFGSSPVSIPLGRNPGCVSPNNSDPNKLLLPPPSPKSKRPDYSNRDDSSRGHATHVSGSQESPSPSRGNSFRKNDALKSGETYIGSTSLQTNLGQKVFRDSREDSGRFSGLISSSSSPRFGFSRSSSRLSLQDDLDDYEFTCPFAVDDVDTIDSHTRNDPSDGKDAPDATLMFHSTRKSQDAAVGALVHMLRTAPPLRQDSSYFSHSSRTDSGTGTFSGTGGGSSFFTSRKTSEALDELQTYREMKNLLLAQSRTQSVTLEPLEATDEVA